MLITFQPKADEKLAAATALLEVATVKPSGYLIPRAIVPEEALPQVMEGIRGYFESKGRPEPVIYFRKVGEVDWRAEVAESTIPDELPADFS
jgi:hypothetical protein